MANNINYDELYKHVPQDIHEAIFDYDIYEKLNNLAILLKLNANQKQLLYQNIFDTLMGVIDINNFKNALISQLQLPTNLADFAFQEINRILFLPLGPSIQRMRDYVQTGLWQENTQPVHKDVDKFNIQSPTSYRTLGPEDIANLQAINKRPLATPQKNINNLQNISTVPEQSSPTTLDQNDNNTLETQGAQTTQTAPSPNTEQSADQNYLDPQISKLMAAMKQAQIPQSKIESVIRSYNVFTTTKKQDQQINESSQNDIFNVPFKRPKSVIEKGTNELPPKEEGKVLKQDIPDILKIKQHPLNTKEIPINKQVEYQKPQIEVNPTKYQKEPKKSSDDDKFIDLSDTM